MFRSIRVLKNHKKKKNMKFIKYHNPLYGHHNQIGIVVSEKCQDGNCSFLTSIPKFGGNYISLKRNDPCVSILKNLSKEELLLTLSKFKFWWFFKHKDLYQYLLINIILAK